MRAAVIHGEGLGKQYRRGLMVDPGLRHALERFVKSPLAAFRRAKNETFWALKDVSLEVKEGEVLGLIGRNGAGKTTLLKILSRITKPTTGWAEIHGRVGSLLEVGTGFHPELTGRENTFLSGAILGMSKREIERKFDEIVAFAELEKFIDTQVKHYSSGMYVRLAFAVAAHLEPEILLVDEVLAVGDITFQRKCLGKMGDVARGGRTIVLVSHNIAAINSLSSRAILLRDGRIAFDGSVAEATALYYSESLEISRNGANLLERPREGNGKARFSSIAIEPLDSNGKRMDAARPGCDLSIDVEIECRTNFVDCNLALIFHDTNGVRVIDTNTAQKGMFVGLNAGQKARARFVLREVLLKPGKYFVGVFLGRHMLEIVDHVENAATLDFVESEETSQHSVIYPGIYLCRFENSFTVS
ncbi:MAG TPA: ABC transporter ATP-binding protein [Candidatus Binatus sp.]|jgi:lipopolysaccharide transport system ATP-binding protein|nr:ABC transporter ATP-binding protein [Candidatus Binatus sp.]